MRGLSWITGTVVICASGVASGATLFDQDVTNNVIFGTGNANGSWTVGRDNGVEIGLRAKLRFDDTNAPQNDFNSNGDGTYTFEPKQPPGGGFGFASNQASTAIWNFEWSINVNYDGSNPSGTVLSDYSYVFLIDGDPTGIDTTDTFDPINQPDGDHAFGDNTTGPGLGNKPSNPSEYINRINNFSMAQNSWNYEFFDDPADAGGNPLAQLSGFDANVPGEFTITLQAFDGATLLTESSIVVQSIPEPAVTLLAGIGLLGLAKWRGVRDEAAAF